MLKLLYEDKYVVVVRKPVGLLSEPMPGQKSLPELLKRQTKAYRVDTVQRLDRNVGGVMVYSKSDKATPGLAKQMAAHRFTKEYLAVVEGKPAKRSGEMKDFLVKNKRLGKVFTAAEKDPDAKPAVLHYTVLEEHDRRSLVLVRLETGRTHQIRVQFASRGIPLAGDTKYGLQDSADNGKTPIGLWSYHLAFEHPVLHKTVEQYCLPPMNGCFGAFSWLSDRYAERKNSCKTPENSV